MLSRISCIVSLILILTIPSFLISPVALHGGEVNHILQESLSLSEQFPHAPIVIWHDDNFTDFGFSGSGTPEQPYIIENLEIASTGSVPCINVSGSVTANYLITNCKLTAPSEGGIGALLNSGIGTIQNCEIFDSTLGVHLEGTNKRVELTSFRNCTWTCLNAHTIENLEIRNCSFICTTNPSIDIGSTSGVTLIHDNVISGGEIYLDDPCVNVKIFGNTIYNNGEYDVVIHIQGDNIEVFDNIVLNDNRDSGSPYPTTCIAVLWLCEDVSIHNNIVAGANTGIGDSGNRTGIFNNQIAQNDKGITEQGHFALIHNNTLYDNTDEGIWGVGINLGVQASDCQVYYNRLFNNDKNAQDSGTNNIWDDGESQGNYWDDYGGSGVYSIPGEAGSVDRFPSVISATDMISTNLPTITPIYTPNELPMEQLLIAIGIGALVSIISLIIYRKLNQS